MNKENNKVPLETYSRVCGFYRPVSGWNKAKIAEFNDRYLWFSADVEKAMNSEREVRPSV